MPRKSGMLHTKTLRSRRNSTSAKNKNNNNGISVTVTTTTEEKCLLPTRRGSTYIFTCARFLTLLLFLASLFNQVHKYEYTLLKFSNPYTQIRRHLATSFTSVACRSAVRRGTSMRFCCLFV